MNIREEIVLFQQWIRVKMRQHIQRVTPLINEGEIWWAAVGKNVGIEINGKSENFSRPVIIYKKFSRLGFLAIPLTSRPHNSNWYVPFIFQNMESYAALAQIRIMSVHRLYGRMGKMTASDFKSVKEGFKKLYVE